MKLKICFLALLCLNLRVFAGTKITPLEIGARVPSIVLSPVLNTSGKRINLESLRGKIIIIDFWATSCVSCIIGLPALQHLQQRFGDSVEVIAVSYEKTETVQRFLHKNAIGKTIRLPMVTEDATLSAMFPHRMLSHEVWIDGKGEVRAITEPEYVNETNISKLLHHEPFSLPVKSDLPSFDYNAPMYSVAPPVSFSTIVPYQPGVAPRFGFGLDSATGKKRLYMVNFPVMQLYMFATGNLLYFPKTLMDIRVKDSASVILPAKIYRDAWKALHYWCYESVMPASTSDKAMLDGMLTDLNRNFSLSGSMEKRVVNCLSLERLSPDSLLWSSHGGKPSNTLHSTGVIKALTNAGLGNIVWELNDLQGGLPAVDNTGFRGKADIQLAIPDFKNLEVLNQALQPYGLVVRERRQVLVFFVLRDAD